MPILDSAMQKFDFERRKRGSAREIPHAARTYLTTAAPHSFGARHQESVILPQPADAHAPLRARPQGRSERLEPGLEIAPLIETFLEYGPANLLRPRGSYAAV